MGQFGKIIMSSEISQLPKINLDETPSRIHGLNVQDEKDLRILGCEWIQTSGILLRLPQIVMATGQILFQRFYYSKSFIRYDMEIVTMSCIYLAAKIEESPRMIGDVLNVFHHMKQIRSQKTITSLNLDRSYAALKDKVINTECLILKVLGVCVHVKHPYKLILMYMQVLGYEKNKKVMQCAWNYMNDSLRTDIFARYRLETIACACIYLAARKTNIPLPNNPPWYAIFEVTEDDITDICYRILDLYNRAKPNLEQLESTVKNLKSSYTEARNQQSFGQNILTTATSTNVAETVPSIVKPIYLDTCTDIISSAAPVKADVKSGCTRKRSNSRSRSSTPSERSKKKSRNHVRSPSLSPQKQRKQNRNRRARSNSREDKSRGYRSNGSRGDKSPARGKTDYRSHGRRDRRNYRKEQRDRRSYDEERRGRQRENNSKARSRYWSSSVQRSSRISSDGRR